MYNTYNYKLLVSESEHPTNQQNRDTFALCYEISEFLMKELEYLEFTFKPEDDKVYIHFNHEELLILIKLKFL